MLFDSENTERKAMEEVAPMEIYTNQRPSLLLTAACAPSAALPSHHESVVMADAQRAPLSQAYQVQTQAELARTLVLGDSGNGTSGSVVSRGFVGSNGIANKTDGASGVPPRGRPV